MHRAKADIRVLGAPERIVTLAGQSRLREDPPGVEIVDDAVIPRCVETDIRIFDPSSDWRFRGWKGGVYDGERTICPASLGRRDFSFVSTPFAPDEIDLDTAEHISGEAVYAGLAFKHFGHFMLESTSRLWWPILEGFRGPIVFQNTHGRERLPAFARRFLELSGLSGDVIVADRALRFDRVVVPHSAFTIRTGAHRCFQAPFLAAGEAAARHVRPVAGPTGDDAAGAYLSRTRYKYRGSLGEPRVEKAFARNGFDIFHMEELPLEQQILVMRRYQTIAGIAGSAFHTMLCAAQTKNAIYLARDYDINENFFIIDEMMGNTATYLYNGAAAEGERARTDRAAIAEAYHSDATLDVAKLFALLEDSGALASPWRWRGY